MKVQLLTTAMLLGLTGYSPAADPGVPLDEPPVTFSWTGGYIGGQVGYAWSRGSGDYINISPFLPLLPESTSVDGEGWLAGGQIGYNYQINNWVFGLEGELAWSDADGKNPVDNILGQVADLAVNVDWLGSLTARAGFAVERTLFYGKAGVGFTEIDLEDSDSATGSDTLTGWTLGAGVEHAFTDHWTMRGEYQFYSFDADIALHLPNGTPFRNYDDVLDIHAIKIGVNYKF
jgi:outer membrane immunogenic protein